MGLLSYGEPQILELFKNTLPSRLYYMLYQINDLRNTVETAKRVLTKEKLNKQKTGQTSASPFMKASKENAKKKNEKGLSFDALETIDRHSDSMDRLASMVNKLDMRLEKKETPYRPKIYQGRNRGHGQRQDSYRSRDRSYSRDCDQYNYRGRRNYNNDTRNYRPNYRNSQEMDIEIGKMMDKTIEGIIMDRIMVTKGIETEVQVKTTVGLGKDTEVIHGTDPIQEIDRVLMVETKAEVDKDPIPMTGKIIEQGLDQACT